MGMSDEWRARSACRSLPVDHFYPPEGQSATAEARAACAACPVRGECLEHAVAHEDHGYWAGTSARERRRMRRERGVKLDTPALPATLIAAGHGTVAGYERHRRIGEEACRSCRAANAAAAAGRRDAQPRTA